MKTFCSSALTPLRLILLISVFIFSSCALWEKISGTLHKPSPQGRQAAGAPPYPQQRERPTAKSLREDGRYFIHTVKWNGESLSIIAAWYTGKLENWDILAKANPRLNPNVIRLGDRIRIPENKMTTKVAMPKEFVAKYVPAIRPPKPSHVKPPGAQVETPEEETELFGPKVYPSD
jgi:hypothetical protein